MVWELNKSETTPITSFHHLLKQTNKQKNAKKHNSSLPFLNFWEIDKIRNTDEN